MRLVIFCLIAVVAAMPLRAADKITGPSLAGYKSDHTLSVGTPLPKWTQPLAEIPATSKPDAVVFRLMETQAWAGTNPAVMVNRAIQVNDQVALDSIGQISLQYFPSYQKISLHRVAIMRGNQLLDRTLVVKPRILQREQRLEARVYEGASTVQLLLDDVRVGDTLWLTYTIEGENPVFGGIWANDFSWDVFAPTERRVLTVLHPRQRPMYWHQLGDFNKEPISPVVDQVGNVERIRFEGKHLAPLEEETSTPSDYMAGRMIQLSEHSDWRTVAQWAAALFPPAEQTASVRTLARKFVAEPDRAAQAVAALHWVQDEIRYFSVSVGENSHRPQSPETVIQRRYGDCKDKAYLLVTLLSQLGIKASPVLVNSDAPKLPSKVKASPTWFNHVLVRIDLDGREFYVDPTKRGQKGPLAQLPSAFPGAFGLLVERSTHGLIELPERNEAMTPFEHIERIVLTSFDGPAILEVRDVYRGAYADWARLRFPAMTQRELQNEVLKQYEKLYPGISLVDRPKLDDKHQESSFEVVSRLNIPKPLSHENGQYRLEYASQIIDGTLGLPDKLVRNHPFILPQGKFKGRYRLTVVWPGVVRHAGSVEAKRLDNPFFQLAEEYTFRGNYLSYVLDYRLKSDRVQAQDLPTLQEKAKGLTPFASASFRVADYAVTKPEVNGFTLRQLDVVRKFASLSEWSSTFKSRKDGGASPEELCGGARGLLVLAELFPAQAPFTPERLFDEMRKDKRPETQKCLAGLLFSQGEYAQSIPLLAGDKSLSDDDLDVMQLAWARLYSHEKAGAAADTLRFVRARIGKGELNAVEMASAIAVLQRAGQAIPSELLAEATARPDGPWPRPLLAMQLGTLAPYEVLNIAAALPADARELALAEAWFYIGQLRLTQNDKAGAAKAFHWVLGNSIRGSALYAESTVELEKMKSDDPDYRAGLLAHDAGKLADAVAFWRKSAERGIPEAQYQLGLLFYDGKGVAQDRGQAMRLFQGAAEHQVGGALHMVGLCYAVGCVGIPDEAAASEWYRRAAEMGEGEAALYLGRRYHEGRGVEKDLAKAVANVQLAAELNNTEAQGVLAGLYRDGDGVPQDYVMAAFWAAIAVERGNNNARLVLGQMLQDGLGVPKDPEKGIELIRLAAENGYAAAEYSLGYCYEYGKGVEQSDKLAVAWYTKSAAHGHGFAKLALGLAYRYGSGVAKDPIKARALFESAAEAEIRHAFSQLGDLYNFGLGVAKDTARARSYYLRAAELGAIAGQVGLAKMLRYGQGGAKDAVEAAKWFRKAAKQDSSVALNDLADMYENGDGVEQDYAQALSLYRQSANKGYFLAFFSLGTLYEAGKGVTADARMAYIYYRLTVANEGTSKNYAESARARAAELAKNLSQDQLTSADAVVAAWKEGMPLPGT